MKNLSLVIILLALSFTTGCKENKKESGTESEMKSGEMAPAKSNETKEITVKLEPKNDSNVTGNVVFIEDDGVVTMTATLNGLTEGPHAIHIHAKGDCSSPDGKSAGGHWNPTNQPHGKWGSAEGYHRGDIGNVEANADGMGTITLKTDEWCIGCGDPNKDIIGKGIIVHQGADDFTSQPSGNAGARVACGAIMQ